MSKNKIIILLCLLLGLGLFFYFTSSAKNDVKIAELKKSNELIDKKLIEQNAEQIRLEKQMEKYVQELLIVQKKSIELENDKKKITDKYNKLLGDYNKLSSKEVDDLLPKEYAKHDVVFSVNSSENKILIDPINRKNLLLFSLNYNQTKEENENLKLTIEVKNSTIETMEKMLRTWQIAINNFKTTISFHIEKENNMQNIIKKQDKQIKSLKFQKIAITIIAIVVSIFIGTSS